MAAEIYQTVDGGGATDCPAPRVDDGAFIGAGIGFGAKFPGQGWMVEHLEEAGWTDVIHTDKKVSGVSGAAYIKQSVDRDKVTETTAAAKRVGALDEPTFDYT
jgi:hypothetical protein